jgi:hypothetical protein
MVVFAGMRGTGDWATDMRPFHWRKDILRIFPGGDMIITGMTSNMKSLVVPDAKYLTWRKYFPDLGADLLNDGVYKDPTLATAYAAADGYAAGAVVYCKMSSDNTKQFKIRHQVLLRCTDVTKGEVDKLGEVVDVVRGTVYYVAVKLLEADNAASPDLSDVDRLMVVGTINPEGAQAPVALAMDPENDYNYTQIFWDTLNQTGTAIATTLRTPDDYMQAKMDCWELHGCGIERAAIYSERYEGTDTVSGKKKRATRGIIRAIAADTYAATYCKANFRTLTTLSGDDASYDYAGKTWEQAGDRFLDVILKNRKKFSKESTVLGICGDGAMLGIQRLVEAKGVYKIEKATKSYGIAVKEWDTVFGTINLVTHPLFSHEATDNYRLLLIEPKEVMMRPITGRDTKFLADPNFEKGGENAVDAKNEGYRTELGLDFGNVRGFCDLNGVGQDNTATS